MKQSKPSIFLSIISVLISFYMIFFGQDLFYFLWSISISVLYLLIDFTLIQLQKATQNET